MKLRIGSKKEPGSSNGSSPVASDPYVDARSEWYERYGSYVKQAYNWRLLAILQSIGLIVAVVGVIVLGSQTKFVPFVVTIDKIGQPVAVGPADRGSTIDPRVVRAQLANWIVNARSVSTDRVIDIDTLDRVYALVPIDSAAKTFLDEYYPAHSPFDLGKTETVQVNVNSILPISPTTYEIQWTETARDVKGKEISTQTWAANATIAFRPPSDEATIYRNPLGLYITNLSWQQKV